MKRFVPLILILSILSQTMGQFAVLTYFGINRKTIIKTECVNLDKPALQCNGKCYLNKLLKKVEDKNDSQKTVKEVRVDNMFCLKQLIFKFDLAVKTLKNPTFFYNAETPFRSTDAIFHPPPYCLIS